MYLDLFKVKREEELKYRTNREDSARKKVVRHINQSTETRMRKEMKKREKTDKLAQSYIAEKYCILYKTFIITGTEILLPQYIFE